MPFPIREALANCNVLSYLVSMQVPNEQVDCLNCRLHAGLCVCDQMPHFELDTKITIIMHQREYFKKTNTGRFIPQILSGSRILWYGHNNRVPFDVSQLNKPGYLTVLLFPYAQARVLDRQFVRMENLPIHMVVLDGNWSQARRIYKRIQCKQNFPVVRLPDGQKSGYHLRATKEVGTVCTFEAVARAVGILESSLVTESMGNFFDEMVRRFLWTRGKILNPKTSASGLVHPR